MVKRSGKYGDFFGCSGYPKCKTIVNISSSLKPLEEKNLRRIETLSPYQQTIENWVKTGEGHAVVKATAGSGKTRTQEHVVAVLIEDLKVPAQDIIYLAFNSHVVKEAIEKGLPAKSTHQVGLQAVSSYIGKKVNVDDNKIPDIIKNLIQMTWDDEKWMISPISQIVSKLKNTLAPWDKDTQAKICDKFGIEVNGSSERIFDLTRQTMELNNKDFNNIDFDDMLYLPVKFKMPVRQYKWVLGDECFPYHVPVLMENNQNLPIGEIVEKKLTGYVLSFNTETGQQEYKKIIGWHKIPNKKQLVKVLAMQHVSCMGGHRAWVVCTEDHKIWTKEKGWVEAKNLEPGLHIQKETLAKTSEKYKISSMGKNILKETISNNNKLGKTGNMEGKYYGGNLAKNRGGNGKGLTEPQQILLGALGDGWFPEYKVKSTKEQRLQLNASNVYKIDIANPELKIAVELDRSLKTASAVYYKKDKVLTELGWKVYHYQNHYVVNNLDEIVESLKNDCPVWCEVVSIKPTTVKEYYVYDISVEDNHNFYANGVLVHNCQDWNRAQIELIKKLVAPDGRVLAVGDENQSMYGFRGAAPDAMQKIQEAFNAQILPLSISYRNPTSHVDLINKIFPNIKHEKSPFAKKGDILSMSVDKMLGQVGEGDLVICRNNAPLVEPVFALIRMGIKATIRGRDIGKGLIALCERFNVKSTNDLLAKLEDYRIKEVAKLLKAEKTNQVQALTDKIDTINALSDGCDWVWQITQKINEVFSDKKEGVIFSTIHRAKGDEAERVFILNPQLMPSRYAKSQEDLIQEQNILFVALSRAKSTLVFVGGPVPAAFESQEMWEEETEKLVIEQLSEIVPEGTKIMTNVEIFEDGEIKFDKEVIVNKQETKSVPEISKCPF